MRFPTACLALIAASGLAAIALASGELTLAQRYAGACGHEACLESRLLMPGRDASGRWNPDTGRDLLNYPPDRVVDYDHMTIRLLIPDMNDPVATAVQTLSFTPIGSPLSTLTLDATALDISRVELMFTHGERANSQSLDFTTDAQKLTITFDPPLPPGRSAEIRTTYTINNPRGGLIWTPETPDWPGRPAQIHTQGEPQTSSLWFPCHDFPNEKLTTQLIVTVPEGFIVSSNGRLVSRTPTSVAGKPYETFDWLQDTPHVNYLVTLVVGKFDVVDVGTPDLPMPVYVPPGRGPDVQASYGKTADMVAFFGELLDEPYPWDQYAQLVVWNFGWGGMENTSATTMYDTAILSPEALADSDLEGLISHELGHQWFGDLITCNSWEHIWLNEGFATYMTALWFEHSRGQDDYQASIRGNFDSVIGAARGHAPETPAMVSKVWAAPWEVFRRQNNPYPHGASVLHMLRRRLGDDAFFAGIAEYLDRTRHTSAETSDFRRAMEDVSGESLERFFWQWCERPGVPRLSVSTEWDSAAGELTISIDQTQHIDGYNPAYAIDLPIVLGGRHGEGDPANGTAEFGWRREVVSMDTRSAEITIHLDREPEIIAIDPDMDVLAEIKFEQPVERCITQLAHGPTLSSRVMAARAIKVLSVEAIQDDRRAEALDVAQSLSAAANDENSHDLIRGECVQAMAALGDPYALIALIKGQTDNDVGGAARPAVRVAAINALPDAVVAAKAARDEALATMDDEERFDYVLNSRDPELLNVSMWLIQHATEPNATTQRAAAIRALGRSPASETTLHICRAALALDSQDDALRQAALDALASLDDPAGLPLALNYTHPRVNSRTRVTAINAAAKLAHHDPQLAYSTLAPLLRDPQRRTFLAAGQALVDLADPRGLEALQSLLAEVPDFDSRWSLESWIAALEAKLDQPDEK